MSLPYVRPAKSASGQAPTRDRQRGFTLLEVLIALAILAILMVGLLKIAANNTRNLRVLENTTIAEQVGHNQLLQLRIGGARPERDEGFQEMAGRRWYWQISRSVEHPLGQTVSRYRVQVFLEGEPAPYAESIAYLPGAA